MTIGSFRYVLALAGVYEGGRGQGKLNASLFQYYNSRFKLKPFHFSGREPIGM